jgi:hypothetical protein
MQHGLLRLAATEPQLLLLPAAEPDCVCGGQPFVVASDAPSITSSLAHEL